VLVAQPRGGYKRIDIKQFDKRKYEPARKTLWGKRRRYWKIKETKVVRYTRTYIFEEGKKGKTPEARLDAVVEMIEPVDMSDEEVTKKLKSRRMDRIMRKMIENKFKEKGQKTVPWQYRHVDLKDKAVWGGWEVRSERVGSFVDAFRTGR